MANPTIPQPDILTFEHRIDRPANVFHGETQRHVYNILIIKGLQQRYTINRHLETAELKRY